MTHQEQGRRESLPSGALDDDEVSASGEQASRDGGSEETDHGNDFAIRDRGESGHLESDPSEYGISGKQVQRAPPDLQAYAGSGEQKKPEKRSNPSDFKVRYAGGKYRELLLSGFSVSPDSDQASEEDVRTKSEQSLKDASPEERAEKIPHKKSKPSSFTVADQRKGHRKRLRSRVLRGGVEGLDDYEVLEILLFASSARADTRRLARELVKKEGSLAKVLHASRESLSECKGLGEAGIVALYTARDLARRFAKLAVESRDILSSWESLMNYLRASMNYLRVEQCRILYLDRRNRLIADEKHGDGDTNQAPLYVREILRRALELSASALIVVHNHPSGDPTPSRADIRATQELRRLGDGMGIVLHDHVIVGRGDNPVSFKTKGLL